MPGPMRRGGRVRLASRYKWHRFPGLSFYREIGEENSGCGLRTECQLIELQWPRSLKCFLFRLQFGGDGAAGFRQILKRLKNSWRISKAVVFFDLYFAAPGVENIQLKTDSGAVATPSVHEALRLSGPTR